MFRGFYLPSLHSVSLCGVGLRSFIYHEIKEKENVSWQFWVWTLNDFFRNSEIPYFLRGKHEWENRGIFGYLYKSCWYKFFFSNALKKTRQLFFEIDYCGLGKVVKVYVWNRTIKGAETNMTTKFRWDLTKKHLEADIKT